MTAPKIRKRDYKQVRPEELVELNRRLTDPALPFAIDSAFFTALHENLQFYLRHNVWELLESDAFLLADGSRWMRKIIVEIKGELFLFLCGPASGGSEMVEMHAMKTAEAPRCERIAGMLLDSAKEIIDARTGVAVRANSTAS